MSTQPEALRLADALEGSFPEAVACSAADELRRLHALNAELLEALTDDEIEKICPKFEDPVRREMWVLGFKAAHGIMSGTDGKGDA